MTVARAAIKWFMVINLMTVIAAESELDVLKNTDVDCGFGYELLMATIERMQEDIKVLQEKVTVLQEKTANNEVNLSCLPAQFCRHYESVQFNNTLPFRHTWNSNRPNRTNLAWQTWHRSTSRNITNLQTEFTTASNIPQYNHNPFNRTIRQNFTSTDYQPWVLYEPLNSTTRQYTRRRLEP